jgi:formylglycine-generating enzyme required for sulfatase activity
MTSVVRNRCVVQASVLFALALAGMLAVGCGSSEQPPAAGNPRTDSKPAIDVESPAEKGPSKPEAAPGAKEEAPGEGHRAPGVKEAGGAKGEGVPETKEAAHRKGAAPPGGREEQPAKAEPVSGRAEKGPGTNGGTPGQAAKPPGEANAAGGAAGQPEKAEVPFDPTGIPTVSWLPEPVAVPESEAKQEADMKPYTERISRTDVTFDMVPIRGGKFMMGSPEGERQRKDDEGPPHEVVIEPFWMGKCEVSWDEYELWGLGLDEQRRKILGIQSTERDKLVDAIAQPTKPYSDMTFGMGKSGYPAICMSQLAARMYCKWLSAKTGRFYRLPTEAEWEYACRAGTNTAYSFGDDPEKLGEYAWYFENSDDKYHKVGQKKPNPWGLYDMHGNVSEWVLDQYVPDYYGQYAGKSTKRPLAVPTTLYPRVARGGCWDDDPDRLRSAARTASTKDWKMQDPQIPQSIWYNTENYCPGFRVVRPLHVPDVEEAKLYEPDYQAVKEYQEAQAGKE